MRIAASTYMVSFLVLVGAGCSPFTSSQCDEPDNSCGAPSTVASQSLSNFRQTDRTQRPQVGSPVNLRHATVTAVDDYIESARGSSGDVWIQQRFLEPNFSGCAPHPEGGVVCGVQLFSPAILPAGSRLLPGDLVNVRGGTYDEFDCTPCCAPPRMPCLFSGGRTLPELSRTSVDRVGSSAAPAPVPATLEQIANGGDQWVGVLVRVNGPINLQPPDTRGEFPIGNGVNLTPQIGPLTDSRTGRPVEAGSALRSVTGIVSYFFGPKLMPRGPQDLEVQ